MGFERLNLFHTKHSSKFENIWSNDRPNEVKNYKVRKCMKSEFFRYTLTRRGTEHIRPQNDFVSMNPEEIFLIAQVFQLKAKKYPNMKVAFERACEFIKALVCGFGKMLKYNHSLTISSIFLPSSMCQTSLKDSKICPLVQQVTLS